MAAYYQVMADEHRVDREVTLGFRTYEKLFAIARGVGATLLVRCDNFHGMDEFGVHELNELRAEIARVRAAAGSATDVIEFLDALDDLSTYAASRGKSLIADAD